MVDPALLVAVAAILIGLLLILLLIRTRRELASQPSPSRLQRVAWWIVASPFVLLGAYLILGLASKEWSARRVGLGSGVLVALILGLIKGLLTAFHRHR